MTKISALNGHNAPANGDELAVVHEISQGVKETRKLSLRRLGEWIMSIGVKITGATPNSLLVVNSDGELENVPGINYDPFLGTLSIGANNTSQAAQSLVITKNSDPAFPGPLFTIRNNHANTAYPSYIEVYNNGAISLRDGQIMFSDNLIFQETTLSNGNKALLFSDDGNNFNIKLGMHRTYAYEAIYANDWTELRTLVQELQEIIGDAGLAEIP